MTQLIITSIGTLLFAGVIASLAMLFQELLQSLEAQGVTCDTCLGTGLDVSRKFVATACKYGCQENHESPYWDLAQALR